jgi:formylmethanofuran dehydrogenase subunit E
VLNGCILGKGNIIYRDHAKQVFTFICRETGKALRVALKASFNIDDIDPKVSELRPKVMAGTATEEEEKEFSERMNGISETMRNTPAEEMFDIRFVDVQIPQKARIFNSVKCARCGEMMAESRARVQDGEYICVPCYEEYTRGW